MIVAIIDLGTNTFNLLLAEILANGSTKSVFHTRMPVRLGEGTINNHIITEKAFERGIETLHTLKGIIEMYNAQTIIALATSAIREARNGREFIQKVKEVTRIEVKVISGEKEAEYIYYGVKKAITMTNDLSLIMDIGGGSTEFIIANGEHIVWKHSFLLGAARIMQKFQPSDRITEKEIKNIEEYLSQELCPLFDAAGLFHITELIGSSGSFESIAEMIAHRLYSPELLKGKTEYDFNLEECHETCNLILNSSRAERLHMKGLIEMRVDMIVVSCIFINLILKKLKLKKIRLSTYSLKEGVLEEWLKSHYSLLQDDFH